jgi:hypothetical protein
MLLHSSPPSTWACADSRSPATVDQGHQIWLNSVEVMRRVVKKTDPTFPMLDGGRLRGTVKLDVLIDGTGKVACLEAVSGNPVAIAAVMAVTRNWQFRPKFQP